MGWVGPCIRLVANDLWYDNAYDLWNVTYDRWLQSYQLLKTFSRTEERILFSVLFFSLFPFDRKYFFPLLWTVAYVTRESEQRKTGTEIAKKTRKGLCVCFIFFHQSSVFWKKDISFEKKYVMSILYFRLTFEVRKN